MSRDGSRRRLLTPDERVLWSIVTRSIVPMHEVAHNDVAAPDRAPPADVGTAPAAKVTASLPSRLSLPPMAPLGRRMRARVARGKEAIDARLDLHGLTQAQAHSTLLHFLRNAQARDARLVLVITGKGARGDGERGVLRRHVPQWLALPELRAFVVGYEDAHLAHGGEGALYVRIRRARNE
jgi:DNA-nicking Smr family endonuclease